MSSIKEATRDFVNQGCRSDESQKDRLKANYEFEAGFLFSRRTLIGRGVCSRSEHEGEQVWYKPPKRERERVHQPTPRVNNCNMMHLSSYHGALLETRVSTCIQTGKVIIRV